MNPFDWSGPDFLALYVGILLLGTLVAFVLRTMLRRPIDLPPEMPSLHPYEVAHLCGGATQAVNAAITRLLDIGALTYDAESDQLKRTDKRPDNPHPLEKALLAPAGAFTVRTARELAADPVGNIRQRLEGLGLEMKPDDARRVRIVPALVLLAVLAFGLIKIAVGISRDAPVLFLVLGSVVTAGLALGFALARVVRSSRGDAVLDKLRQQHDALRLASTSGGALSGNDLPMAVGLFGTGILAGTTYAHMRRALQPQRSTGDAWSDTGGGCGGGCGSGSSSSDTGGGWLGGGDAGGGDAGGGDAGGGSGCGGCGGGGCGGGGGD